MGTTLKEMLKSLPTERVQKIQKREKELKAEELEMSLSEIRKSFTFTQEEIANILKVDQASVSRAEKRTDQLVSTVREYVEAMGGELKLVADFPDRPPIKIAKIEIIDKPKSGTTKKHKQKRSKPKLSVCDVP